MKDEQLINMCKEYTDTMTVDKIESILASNSMLYRHTLTNRILIDIQEKSSGVKYTDVRTPEEWYMLGRRVEDTTQIVRLIDVVEVRGYVDKETGKSIGYADLSAEEMRVALNSGLIEIDESTLYTKIVNGYDLSNTYEIEKNKYKPSVTLGFFNIDKICTELFGISFCIEGTHNTGNKIEVPREPVEAICKIIDSIVESQKSVNSEMLKYALMNIFGLEAEITEVYSAREIESVQNVIRTILQKYFTMCGYSEQANIGIKEIEKSKKMLDLLNSCMAYMEYRA